jgi:alkanesulfonate monooxygenase SsuD/methylene tetrahydromethanopterin reductase-like flavin-dependent oxidoreductase (luciferase family)
MARKLTIGINWQGRFDFKALVERAKIADRAGIHSIWVAEAWGRDAFSLLTLLAEHTERVRLATGIVNIYSRSPAALAQHFATLDELSGGRMIIGLGTSGPNVIEHFHGIPFNPPFTRLSEYVDIINMILAGTPLNYGGKLFRMERGFTLRFEPPRKHIPIFLASIKRKSVEFTARKADGWLPVMIPLKALRQTIADFRAIAKAAGREAGAVEVRAPGRVVVTRNVERARAAQAATLAFYAVRMGTFYAEQLGRVGFGAELGRIKQAWQAAGSKAGAQAVPDAMLAEMGYAGDIGGARERLKAQEEAGADLHSVAIETADPAAFEKTVQALLD